MDLFITMSPPDFNDVLEYFILRKTTEYYWEFFESRDTQDIAPGFVVKHIDHTYDNIIPFQESDLENL